ncbi:MAG: hypothetical protein OXI41_03095 [Chloroflexota bacterium]|nr:hypothetical protein [Chloroflexota bacterium]
MKYVRSKSWPWPVLRHGSSDYKRSEFQCAPELNKIENTTQLHLEADFYLGDRNLTDLIAKDHARYGLLVSCSTTHFRKYLECAEPRIEWYAEDGRLAGRVEITPFVVAHRRIDNFKASNWHDDYANRSFTIEPGSVLAIDLSVSYWVVAADETPISSVFQVAADENMALGAWRCDWQRDPDLVTILLHPAELERFQEARSRAAASQTAAYILNGVYLPALAWLLTEADRAELDDLSGARWFEALTAALARAECRPLGERDSDRLLDAQKILRQPFGRLPLLQHQEE